MREIIPLFSKPFYKSELNISDDDLNNLKNIISKIEYNKLDVDYIDNVASLSKNNYILNEKPFLDIKNKICDEFKIFFNNNLHHVNNFKMTTSWIAKSEPGQMSQYHNHSNCMFSGIFYIDTFENSGDICFTDFRDKRFSVDKKNYNVLNSTSWTFEPKEKMILFFPSEVHHQILKNNSNNTRYSIAFNFIPIGKLAYGDSELEI